MTVREEIQITDLEPSIEGGQDVSYVVQIRGIDADGRPGPWSEQFEFTSPEQIPSLESFNYVPGESGWKLNNDGSFEVNDGTIRGTLQSLNYEPGVSGWTLFDNGNVEFSTGIFRGALQIGTNTFNVDSNGNMFIGGSSLNTAPFAVNTNGQIVAMSIAANFIQAKTITADQIQDSAIVGSLIANSTITGAKIAGGTITGALIDNSTITGAKIANATIVGANIAAGAITADKIASNYVYAGTIDAGQISGGSLSGFSVSALNLSASAEFNVQSGRLRVQLGGAVSSNTNMTAGGYMLASDGFRVGFSGPRYIAAGADAHLDNLGSSGTLRVDNIIEFNTGVDLTWSTSTGRVYRPTSSLRTKKDIVSIGKLDNLLDIDTVLFKPKLPWEIEGQEDLYDPDFDEPDVNEFQVGAIAEQLQEIGLDLLLEFNSEGEPSGIKYNKIGVVLIPYVKELYDRIEQLERQLNGN